ncbi:DUF484 family protein [Biformimicrobium ophioploci]|uniref:DUF484 family protein n=1 Tax=Biformimicrobium ophioploci TaxID=3036711 RepID=A0ABQ6LV59_9GAMM|nr:DUF484 family protein [Microbulbifer sp. NKW57]GMG85949.1 DUF484 family protein [Microbulbifer sp. NKW57]
MTEQTLEEQTVPAARDDGREKDLVARQVSRYLRNNPQFFLDNLELLDTIQIPQENGKTVSLLAHQVKLLRERNVSMRQRLDQLLETARSNDQLFHHTRTLVLQLLDADSVAAVTAALYRSFREDFGVAHTSLYLFKGSDRAAPARRCSLARAEENIGGLLRTGRTFCGTLRDEEKQFLFGEDASEVASAAVVPLADELGILAIGNPAPDHYRSSLDTMFLSYIAEVLQKVLPQLAR